MLFLIEVNGRSPWLLRDASDLEVRLWQDARCLASINLISPCGCKERELYRSVPTLYTMEAMAAVADHVFLQLKDMADLIEWDCEKESMECVG